MIRLLFISSKKFFINFPQVLVFFLCISCTSYNEQNIPSAEFSRVTTGLEYFISYRADEYRGKRCALFTNHSGFDSQLRRNLQLLRDEGIIIDSVFAPEHGFAGFDELYSDTKKFDYPQMSVTVYNLNRISNSELKKFISAFDFIIFDIQDMGMRCYTYISNLKTLMDILNDGSRELVVLDRPNPIAPFGVDGFFLDQKFRSQYTASFPAPLIYGLTIGEAANYYKGQYAQGVNLTIIRMKNYSKKQFFGSTSLPWIPPSPNLPSYNSAIIYSWVVMLEGVNLSLGRGTTNPFEYIGAPWISPDELADGLNSMGLKSFSFRPVRFQPKYLVYKDRDCGGVHIVYNGGYFTPSEVAYKVISFISRKYPQFKWNTWAVQSYHEDNLAGTDKFRTFISSGEPYEKFEEEMNRSNKEYISVVKKYLLY